MHRGLEKFIISIFLIFAALGTTITAYDNYCRPKTKRRSSDGEINVKKNIHSDRGNTSNQNSEGNLNGLKPWVNHWVASFLLNGAFKISFYFVLSGFLNGYFVSRYYFQNGGIPWLYFCWKRLERTAPLSAMILGFYATLFSYTGSGPLWPTYDTNPVCKESWWWNLFFINNFQTTWEQCYIPLWHVAIDMQFHLVAPLFLVSLFKWPRFGYGLITLSICASCCYRCIVTIKYSLFQHCSNLDTLRENCGIIRKQASTDGGMLWKVMCVDVEQVPRKNRSPEGPQRGKIPC
ncbi:nose resistant to fluoxetine protein 6 [Trichonephila clavipes]|nr:nose resistant to fluoxetine protein 6 [Trichonephila clavipes]